MDSGQKSELVVQGIAASDGIAYGEIFLYLQTEVEVPVYQVDPDKRVAEIGRFEQALVVTRQQISKIKSEVEKNLGPDEARIFDAHLMVLEDEALIGETVREFESTGGNIETCFNRVSQRYVKAFDEINDEYLRERAGDLRDVAQRVLQNLLGQAEHHLSELAEKRVVVANDISPSDAASIDRSAAIGIVTDSGSKTSHAVIVARSLKIPAVVGVRDLTARVESGDRVLIDGYEGIVVVNPTEQTLFRYGRIQSEKKTFESRLLASSRLPAETLDGVHVPLLANIEKVEEVADARDCQAEGVGLFRTEYLYLNSPHLPGEAEQFTTYKAVAEAFAPQAVVIRTLDIGGDKPLVGMPGLIHHETNPFLGFRAIRLCLEHPEMFKEQLRAILRASAFGKVRIMYPMISGVDELTRANAVLAEAREELRQRGERFDEKMEVGSMIEIPSAAATTDILARHCQFFSIGTNDLIQYLLAIDRVNNRIAHLYEPTHPAVLRTIKAVVEDAHRNHVPVAVCGEMAGDPVFTPLLLGLGVDELSMTPPALPAVKYLVRAMKMSDARRLATEALTLSDPKEIYARAEEFYQARVKVD
ncbi:MAG TPA: phosphoenolpyruvate--protein phosphotransferase [Opitutaceae bacterium]|nr:phosphoenolpyruvate--protein phosphotransferase [Opitutaceae bacterium]